MLVLTRKKGEAVVLEVAGVTIRVSLCEVRSDKVRIGFEAPDEVSIMREELLEQQDRVDKIGEGE